VWGRPARGVGTVTDDSRIDSAESAQRRAEVARDQSERRYRHLVEHSLGLICVHDLDGRLLSVNPAAARSLGYEAHEGTGRNLREFLAPETRHLFDDYLLRIREKGTDSGLMRVVARDGSERVWLYQNVRYEEPGAPPYILGHGLDVTDRIRIEKALRQSQHALKRAYADLDARVQERTAELRHANDMLGFLATASEQLTRALDYESTLNGLASLPVPLLADWTVIYLANQDGTFRSITGKHADAGLEPMLRQLAAARDVRLPETSWVARVMATAQREVISDAATEPGSFLGPGPHSELASELGLGSLVIVPFLMEGRRGALSLVSSEPQRFPPSDVAVIEDLVRRFQVAIDRVRLYREAQDANRLKEEFLATLSHELRTPVNAILGWARILRTRPLEGGILQAVEVIERNAKAQTRLIEDMLDVSRIVTGKLTFNLETIDLATVIGAALDAVRPAAQAKNIRLVEHVDPMTSPIQGDAHRLQQVIWNLLSNAIKFTQPGGVVTIALHGSRTAPARPPAARRVEVTVSDTGAGIRREVLPFVFDRFRQADSSTTRSHGGLGLGLAIVRHVVELHGGTVEAHSAGEGKGATFRLELPVRDAWIPGGTEGRPIVDEDAVAAAWEPLLQGRRVLVVDDHADARQLIGGILEASGASVITTASSREAFAALSRSAPDVLIADIGLPEEDGYALIRRIRRLDPDHGGRIPAIALTAYARAEDKDRALAAGFQRHVAKPVEPHALVRIVASTLEERATNTETGPR
jgi:PAS domain S-box-containing protein